MKQKEIGPVSVVIPCFRCGATITRAIESVARQTVMPAEVILVDDGNQDDTAEVLARLQKEYGAAWLKIVSLTENGGAAKARNAGWELASQPYLCFLDADDSWHQKKLEIQLGFARGNRNAALIGHASLVTDGTEKRDDAAAHIDAGAKRITKTSMLISNRFSTPTVMLKRGLSMRFDSSKRRGEDYLLWLEICLSGEEVFWLPQQLAYIHKARYGAGGLSGDLLLMQFGEIDAYKKLREKGLISSWTLYSAMTYSWVKYFRRAIITSLQRRRALSAKAALSK